MVKGIERIEIETCVCNKKRISFRLPSYGYNGMDYVIYELVVRKGKRKRRRSNQSLLLRIYSFAELSMSF